MCPWKLGQGHRNIKKKLFKLSQWYAQTTTYWFIRYHAFTQEREWGEWYANTNIVADKIRTKICPTSSWVGGDQKSSLCLKTNQAKCSSLKEWQKEGEIKLSFATIECNIWQNAGVNFSLLCSKLLCILFAHTCIWSIMIYVPISCKMPSEWRNSFNLVDLYP